MWSKYKNFDGSRFVLIVEMESEELQKKIAFRTEIIILSHLNLENLSEGFGQFWVGFGSNFVRFNKS